MGTTTPSAPSGTALGRRGGSCEASSSASPSRTLENGFTVARLAPNGATRRRPPPRTMSAWRPFVGTLPDLQPGEAIAAKGWWKNDPKHGWQFQALAYRTTLPATLQGMKRYLGAA